MHREFKVIVLSVNRFACVSWYSMDGQYDEFNNAIFNACATIDDQPIVHKESQQVPVIKIESYTLAPFPNTMTFSAGYHAKKFTIILNKINK